MLPIKLWGANGPNPPKVAIVLEELGLPYEKVAIGLDQMKQPEYLAINPNGRIPAIFDPNTNLTLWESGAILLYLTEHYDKDRKLGFAPGSSEGFLAKQWLFFQVSGQGPYYGQSIWFKKYHPERVPTAVDRYVKEINRVTSVLEGHLTKQKEASPSSDGADGPWLVGDKYSYADLSFIPWQIAVERMLEKDEYDVGHFPHVNEWLGKMRSRPAVKRVLEDAEKAEH